MTTQVPSQSVPELQTALEQERARADKFLAQLRSVDMFDRAYVQSQGTMAQRQRYQALARQLKADIIRERQALGGSYLDLHAADPQAVAEVPQDMGHASADLSANSLVRNVVAEGAKIYADAVSAQKAFPSKMSLEFVGSADGEFSQSTAMFQLASSPLLLKPIIGYFGMMPILSGFGIALARNNAFYRKSSQRLHLDPEDRSQLKVFVYLTDVDTSSGPFMAASAKASAHLLDKPDGLIDRHDDSVVAPGSIQVFLGPAGTVIFCDTCRCLHAGAREGTRERLVLAIEYNMPTYLGAPLVPGDTVTGIRTRAIKVDSGDPHLDALLGRTLI